MQHSAAGENNLDLVPLYTVESALQVRLYEYHFKRSNENWASGIAVHLPLGFDLFLSAKLQDFDLFLTVKLRQFDLFLTVELRKVDLFLTVKLR